MTSASDDDLGGYHFISRPETPEEYAGGPASPARRPDWRPSLNPIEVRWLLD